MPGSFNRNTAINAVPREIKNDLKDRVIVHEAEHPVRWSFMKILREYSTLKEFYPEINPYTECYKVRDNVWALYNDSFDGAGAVWMYLINGPKKAMIFDTSFGIGDLKGLIKKLVGEKEIIVFNSHSHYDHCYGNAQFGKAYCHEYELADMETKNNAHIWDYLINQTDHDIEVWGEIRHPGQSLYTDFDPKDIIEYKPWQIETVKDGHLFDLGDGYIVEAVLLPGHTPGQCGIYDHQNHCIFVGDLTGIGQRKKGWPFAEYCTVEALNKALKKLQPRFGEISGVFPGHGSWDQSPILLQYLLNTTEQILENPNNADTIKQINLPDGSIKTICMKNIHQWTALRYSLDNVYMSQVIERDNQKEE